MKDLKCTTVYLKDDKNKKLTFNYSGEVNDKNVPHGKGVAKFDNGDIYEGSFDNGVLTADTAVYTYKNGDKYRGSFKNDYFVEGRYTILCEEDKEYS